MRLLIAILMLCSLLAPSAMPLLAAEPKTDPCDMALSQLDLPPELRLEQPDGSSDPLICERIFRGRPTGQQSLSMVRSTVVIAASPGQAKADYEEYRLLLLEAGWEEGDPQSLGEEGLVFVGTNVVTRVFSAQQLFRRGSVVSVVEATGPALEAGPELVIELAQIVDTRISIDFGAGFANPVRSGSIWPAVSAPTIVADAYLSPSPLVGQSVQLGGLSGLASLDADGTRFVAVTDRGPYSDLASASGDLLVLPLPAYTPSIAKLKLQNGQLRVAERFGLRLQDGYTNPRTGSSYVTGLPNTDDDPAAFGRGGQQRWGTDPYGVDPEGIAVDPRDGSYWIAEEYGPSILQVAPDGTIMRRLMPVGRGAEAVGQNVREILPAELALRKPDRGFEGIAISPDGSRLFVIVQSPLSYPDRSSGEASRNVRLLAFDLAGPEPALTGIYVYQTESAAAIGFAAQDDLRTGDLAALSTTRLLVAERDSLVDGPFKMIYRVDLDQATNLLLAPLEGLLEQYDEHQLWSAGVTVLPKNPLVNLATLNWRLEKLEGLTVVDESTIAVVNDNNFGYGGYDPAGRLLTNGVPTRLTLVHLPGSLFD